MAVAREHEMADVFVELADTLVDNFDVAEYLDVLTRRCVEMFDVDMASLLLADARGEIGMLAASSEDSALTDLFDLQGREGPCLDCFRTAEVVSIPDLTAHDARWPAFVPAASRVGLRSVTALPMRLRHEVVGALNLFRMRSGELAYDDLRSAQAMANVATIGLLQERAISRQQVLAEQLQTALNSRVLIEQAKGVLSERLRLDMNASFTALRSYARSHNLLLSAVARSVVEGKLTPPPAEDRRKKKG
jgi:transcriptional regulator with GAF, ATPase, and Fis domain